VKTRKETHFPSKEKKQTHSFFFKKQEKNETMVLDRFGSRNWYSRSVPIISSVCYGMFFNFLSTYMYVDSNTHFINPNLRLRGHNTEGYGVPLWEGIWNTNLYLGISSEIYNFMRKCVLSVPWWPFCFFGTNVFKD
jgi:hypothetical protein